MRYTSIAPLLAFAFFATSSAQEECPELPSSGVEIGEPVPIVPGDVPRGCSDYEILYPASSQIISGGRQGVDDIVQRLTAQSSACPNQTFSLVGYSQGASIMHRAADRLPTSLFPKIKSVVMFGDPNLRLGVVGDKFPNGLKAKVLQICAKGDPVCDSGSCQFNHLTYIRPEYIEGAVTFIVRAFKGMTL
ncbi:uncharacterized protein J4E92_005711 [Alternaria infectoria]|uniref:uncharacterized protein n=1 Tax=Alternaria infectoria TaxID=45303 RepID=UPI00221FCB7F|nr:uncharacterized protein J4E92_005711 [Alternaria infectoria]KAI4928227.1 hypothetical protein J4E92_005711 [Alternaria infectoria]